MSAMKITFLIAVAGHLLCGVCDCLLTYMPGGRFRFDDMKDNKRLSAVFKDMPTRVGGSGNWAGAIMFLGLMFLL